MDIATGSAESHPTPLALNPQPAPDPVTPRFPGASGPSDAGPQVGGVRDTTGERLAQLAAGEAEWAAAQSAGMSADSGRRTGYEADMSPLAASYGDLMGLPDVVSDWSKHTGGSDAQSYDPAG